MSYKSLKNFQDVFRNDYFTYISDHRIMRTVSDIISTKVAPLGTDLDPKSKEECKIFLETFLHNLDGFYGTFFGQGKNSSLDNGRYVIHKTLELCIKLLSKPTSTKIGRNYPRKWNKTFLSGLSKLSSGIEQSFDLDVIGRTKIVQDRSILIRYILEKNVGLGQKFEFNKATEYSFANMINRFTLQQLLATLKFLVVNNPGTKKGTEWLVLGKRNDPVRIVYARRHFARDRVYHLFRAMDHRVYDKVLWVPPDKTAFVPA